MKKTLIIHIGKPKDFYYEKNSISEDILYLYDVKYKESIVSISRSRENIFFTDYLSPKEFKQTLKDLFPADSILIYTQEIPQYNELDYIRYKQLLTEYLECIKNIYRYVMRQKEGKIWVAGIKEEQKTSDIKLNTMIKTTNAGIAQITKIAALELSSRNVTLNYIKNTADSINHLMEVVKHFASQADIYITGTTLTV